MNRELGRGEVIFLLGAVFVLAFLEATGHEIAIVPLTVVLLLLGYVVGPLLVLIHELGHAVAVVALTGGRAFIQLGDDRHSIHFSFGKVDIAVRFGGQTAHCEWFHDRTSRARVVAIALAGPAASLLAGGVLIAVALTLPDPSPAVFWGTVASGAISVWFGVGNAIPFQALPSWWPGAMHDDDTGPSDGRVA